MDVDLPGQRRDRGLDRAELGEFRARDDALVGEEAHDVGEAIVDRVPGVLGQRLAALEPLLRAAEVVDLAVVVLEAESALEVEDAEIAALGIGGVGREAKVLLEHPERRLLVDGRVLPLIHVPGVDVLLDLSNLVAQGGLTGRRRVGRGIGNRAR